jgi:hypothetical protein
MTRRSAGSVTPYLLLRSIFLIGFPAFYFLYFDRRAIRERYIDGERVKRKRKGLREYIREREEKGEGGLRGVGIDREEGTAW